MIDGYEIIITRVKGDKSYAKARPILIDSKDVDKILDNDSIIKFGIEEVKTKMNKYYKNIC